MTGRHRRPRRLSKEGRRLLGGVALVAVFAPVTAYTLNAAIAHVRSCGTETTLTVAAAPEMAPVLQRFIADGGGAPPRGSDVCAEYTIESVPSSQIGESDADAWVPETAMLLDLPDAGLAERWEVIESSTAAGSVGLALPEEADPEDVGLDGAVALEDPRTHPPSLVWITVVGLDQDAAEDADDSDAHLVASGPETQQRNETDGAGLRPPVGDVQVGQFEYPMLVAADLDQDRREAASNLISSYATEDYKNLLTEGGFGPAVPQTPPRDDNDVPAAVEAWDEAH